MTATATAIAGGDLSQRVPDVAAGTEAGELGDALNTMLGRIEAAFDERTASEERLRQFVADASHELRTPVTTIRGYAELYRTGGLDDRASSRGDAAHRAGGGAHGRARRRPAAAGPARPGPPARAATGRPRRAGRRRGARRARPTDPDRPITASSSTGALVVLGDDDRLRQVVGQPRRQRAGAHAAGHADRGAGRGATASASVLEVEDHGPGMSDGGRGPGLRALLPRRPGAVAPPRRHRARPRDRRGDGRRPRRHRCRSRATPGRGTTVRVELPTRDPARDDGARGEWAPSSVGDEGQVDVSSDEPSGVEPSSD